MLYTKINNCRVCASTLFEEDKIISLEKVSIPGLFFNNKLDTSDYKTSLEIVKCKKCLHIQLLHDINSNLYEYYKSGKPTDAHFNHIDLIANNFKNSYPKNAKILEIGGGAGYFLNILHSKGFYNLFNIDATDEISQNNSYTNINSIFPNENISEKYAQEFDVVFTQHFLEHVADPKEILLSIRDILKEEGELWIEVPYIEKTATTDYRLLSIIYSLHSSNFHKKSLEKLGEMTGFKLKELKRVNHYGKSIIAIFNKQATVPSNIVFNDDETNYNEILNGINRFFGELEQFSKSLPNNIYCWGAAERCITILSTIDSYKKINVDGIFDSNEDLWFKKIAGFNTEVSSVIDFNSNIKHLLILSPTNHIDIVKKLFDKANNYITIYIPFVGIYSKKNYELNFLY